MNQEFAGPGFYFVPANPRQTKMLICAMRAEIQLLRYWMLQTLRHYRMWQAEMPVAGFGAKNIVDISEAIPRLIAKAYREYRRKQSLLQNLLKKQNYFNDREIQYYRIENHFGAGVAAMFANDNYES
ncbi:MAG: hypothetical protein EYC62_08010 [Alphaproteobacteria bacterium]|nr:MAG: hypothetical protein EYC62_08010 [Alphaproteobacteria bacterium]